MQLPIVHPCMDFVLAGGSPNSHRSIVIKTNPERDLHLSVRVNTNLASRGFQLEPIALATPDTNTDLQQHLRSGPAFRVVVDHLAQDTEQSYHHHDYTEMGCINSEQINSAGARELWSWQHLCPCGSQVQPCCIGSNAQLTFVDGIFSRTVGLCPLHATAPHGHHSCCNYCDMLLMKNSTLATSPGVFVACSDCSGKPLKLPSNSKMRLCKLIHTRNFLEETLFKPPAWPISDKTEPCMLITCAYFHEPPANDSLLTDRLLRTCRHL